MENHNIADENQSLSLCLVDGQEHVKVPEHIMHRGFKLRCVAKFELLDGGDVTATDEDAIYRRLLTPHKSAEVYGPNTVKLYATGRPSIVAVRLTSVICDSE